jgi:hypothetical protein
MKGRILLKTSAVCAQLIVLTSVGCGLCNDEIQQRTSSPDGKRVAIIYVRDCGATTSARLLVNLQDPKDEKPRSGDVVFVVKHAHPVTVSWEGNETLVINCIGCDNEIEKKVAQHGIVRINYKPAGQK